MHSSLRLTIFLGLLPSVLCCFVPHQVTFEQDVIVSQMNEYEVLQLLMGECRESLAAYKTSLEEDTKLLQVSSRSISNIDIKSAYSS